MTPANEVLTIFDLLSSYHRSLENMKAWLDEANLSSEERIGIADAWQEEAFAWFHSHGYCFACNRNLQRCRCDTVRSESGENYDTQE